MTDKEAGKVVEQFHETLLQYFQSNDDDPCHKKTMYDGYFWLTLFCEKIDPVLGIYNEN